MSFRTQIVFAILIILILASAIISAISYNHGKNIIIENAIRAVSVVAKSREEILLQFLSFKKDRLNGTLLLINRNCQSTNINQKKTCAANLVQNQLRLSGAKYIEFLDSRFSVLIGDKKFVSEKWLYPEKEQIARFQSKEGKVFFTLKSGKSDGEGEIRALFSSEDVTKIFHSNELLGVSGETFLADSSGLFLTPPKYKSRAGHSHPIEARPMKQCLSGKDDEVLDPDYRGVPVIHGFRHIEELGGACIMAHIDQKEAFASTRNLLKEMGLVFLAIIILSSLIAVWIAALFTKPLAILEGKAKSLSSGKLDVKIPALKTRELNTFADAFRSMAESLTKDIKNRKETLKVLNEAVKSRDEFLSVASHELKTPLTSMKLQTQITQRKMNNEVDDPDYLKKYMALIERQVNRLNRLVDDMLELSRISSGKLQIHYEQYNLTQLVRDVVDRSREENHQEISLKAEDNIVINMDPFRIEQVIVNLISNALKYGEKRPVEVAVSKNNDFATITIKDYGRGISKSDQDRIFNRFERAVTASEVSGLGLGLYIVRQILDLHGGSISVESEIGHGSIFRVNLPLLTSYASSD